VPTAIVPQSVISLHEVSPNRRKSVPESEIRLALVRQSDFDIRASESPRGNQLCRNEMSLMGKCLDMCDMTGKNTSGQPFI
jgi:hypothetical protein